MQTFDTRVAHAALSFTHTTQTSLTFDYSYKKQSKKKNIFSICQMPKSGYHTKYKMTAKKLGEVMKEKAMKNWRYDPKREKLWKNLLQQRLEINKQIFKRR